MNGINIKFPDGSTFWVPTTENRGMMVAIVEEFLDACETQPLGPIYTDLPVRFLAWFAGSQDLGIRVGAGAASGTVTVGWIPTQLRPTAW